MTPPLVSPQLLSPPVVVELVSAPPLGPLVAVVEAGRLVRLAFDVTPTGVPVAADAIPGVADLRAGIARWLASGDGGFAEPDDLAATGAFPAAVYRALWGVPAGERLTYGDLARRAGHPGAARAVGRAMAANPWPLVVPCHRVVPAAGGIGNYAGGAARKAWMLAVEQAGGAAQAGP